MNTIYSRGSGKIFDFWGELCSRISGCADFGRNVDGIGNETQFIVEGPGKYGFRTSGCATFGSNVYG